MVAAKIAVRSELEDFILNLRACLAAHWRRRRRPIEGRRFQAMLILKINLYYVPFCRKTVI
jgi:hypothetical protein